MKKILKFEATWCQPCKQMDKVLENVMKEFPTVEVTKIDIDKSPEIALKYGIRGIPTLIFFAPANGEDEVELIRLVGAKTEQQVRDEVLKL